MQDRTCRAQKELVGIEVFDGVAVPPVLVAGVQQDVGHLPVVVQVARPLIKLTSGSLPGAFAGAKSPLRDSCRFLSNVRKKRLNGFSYLEIASIL